MRDFGDIVVVVVHSSIVGSPQHEDDEVPNNFTTIGTAGFGVYTPPNSSGRVGMVPQLNVSCKTMKTQLRL